MPGVVALCGALHLVSEWRLEELEQMRADDDGMGQLYSTAPIERHIYALERARRDTKLSLTIHMLDGWTAEQHQFWVATGVRP